MLRSAGVQRSHGEVALDRIEDRNYGRQPGLQAWQSLAPGGNGAGVGMRVGCVGSHDTLLWRLHVQLGCKGTRSHADHSYRHRRSYLRSRGMAGTNHGCYLDEPATGPRLRRTAAQGKSGYHSGILVEDCGLDVGLGRVSGGGSASVGSIVSVQAVEGHVGGVSMQAGAGGTGQLRVRLGCSHPPNDPLP